MAEVHGMLGNAEKAAKHKAAGSTFNRLADSVYDARAGRAGDLLDLVPRLTEAKNKSNEAM